MEELLSHLLGFGQRASVPTILCLCPSTAAFESELTPTGLAALKGRIREVLREGSSVQWFDMDEWHGRYAVTELHDPARELMGQIPFTDSYYDVLGTVLAREIHREFQSPIKVIALDCDQTLWGGVCGEDAVSELRLAPRHMDLQRRVLAMHEAGVLVVLVSKNREEDVRRVFDERSDMLLRWEHVVGHRINWLVKSENLVSLAEEPALGCNTLRSNLTPSCESRVSLRGASVGEGRGDGLKPGLRAGNYERGTALVMSQKVGAPSLGFRVRRTSNP